MLTIKFNDLNLIPRSHVAEGELAPDNCSRPSRCAPCWVHRSKEGREETLLRINLRGGEMAHQLRALVALAEDPDLALTLT